MTYSKLLLLPKVTVIGGGGLSYNDRDDTVGGVSYLAMFSDTDELLLVLI